MSSADNNLQHCLDSEKKIVKQSKSETKKKMPTLSPKESHSLRALLPDILQLLKIERNWKSEELRLLLKYFRYVTNFMKTISLLNILAIVELAPMITEQKQRKAFLKIFGQIEGRLSPVISDILKFLGTCILEEPYFLWHNCLLSSQSSSEH